MCSHTYERRYKNRFPNQRLEQDSRTALTVFRHRSSQNMKIISSLQVVGSRIFFSSSFIPYFWHIIRWWMRQLRAAAGEKKQNIMSKGCTIVLFWDFVIYERTLSSQSELNTVKFPESRKFSVKKDSARKRWKRKKSISLCRYCCCATRQTCLIYLLETKHCLTYLKDIFFQVLI